VVVVTSGAASYQNWTDFQRIGKGLIPPFDKYQIRTDGYRLATKGVEGMFYPIEPSKIYYRLEGAKKGNHWVKQNETEA